MRLPRPGLAAALVAALLQAACGGGTITFGGDDDGDGSDARVTVKGNLDEVSPVTTRDIVVFAFSIDDDDDSDRCPCPPDPSDSKLGKAVVLENGEATFSLSGLDAGPIGVVFLLDNPGDAADGTIDDGDPIAVLDDVDCEIDDVDGDITVDLEDIDIVFPEEDNPAVPDEECKDGGGDPPLSGRARADQIRQSRSQDDEEE